MPQWMRLDNAATIYPATMTRGWTALFRLSVTLKEEIDLPLLHAALKATLKRIPLFSYRLRRGFFWFYMDRQAEVPAIELDVTNPCVRIHPKRNRQFMFRIRCHERRIAVEIFHALTDGAGGMTFLLTLAAQYLRLKYGDEIPEAPMVLDCRDKPAAGEWEDSFLRYARQATRSRGEEAAYRYRGTPTEEGDLRLITGIVPTENLAAAARQRGATVNTFLVSVLLKALADIASRDPRRRSRGLPVKVSMPVNLRRFYPSRTLRNFSSYINAAFHPDYGEYSLEDIIAQVHHFAGMELTEPMLNARFSANVAAERIKAVRSAPLFVKKLLLMTMYRLVGMRYITATLSNIGVLKLPGGMAERVARADFILVPGKSAPCACGCVSAGGSTYINFSRKIRETGLEMGFFTALVALGIPVTVESNRRETECPTASSAG